MKKFRTLKMIAAAMAAVLAIQVIPFSAMAVGDEINDTIDHEAIIDKLHADEAENAEAQAIVAEETGMRSENEKHYRLEDGSYVAAQYPTAVHYKDENGNWVDIDNTLSFEESKSDEDFDGYTNNENSFSVKLANDAKDQLFRLNDGEGSVSMKLSESAVQSSEISVENADSTAAAQSALTIEEQNEAAMSLDALTSKAEYADVMPGVDLEYTVMPDGVKEYIVVNEKLSDYEFSFELALGDMYLRENDDNSISIMTAGGEEKYIIPAPYMTDANDRYSDAVEYTVSDMGGGVYTLTVTADAGWIEDSETAFPVRIDPTVIMNKPNNGNVTSVYVSSSNSDTCYTNKDFLYVGNDSKSATSLGITRSLIKCSVTKKLHHSYAMISARLRLYQSEYTRDTNPTIEAHYITSKWSFSQTNWNHQPEYSEDAFDVVTVTDYSDGAYIELDVTKEIETNLNNNGANLGIMLKASDESAASNTVRFESNSENNKKAPQLEVFYRVQQGIEDDYSYVKFDCGESGTAYVNAYNGDLSFINKTLSAFNGAVEINHIYGTHILNAEEAYKNDTYYTPDTNMGIGWMISAQEFIVPISEKEYTGIEIASPDPSMYVYNNEYGTNMYLIQSATNENEFVDRDGRDYKLNVIKSNGEITGYTLTNPDGEVKTFEVLIDENSTEKMRAKGYIKKYASKNGEIIYNYAADFFAELENIRLKNNRKSIAFTYDDLNDDGILVTMTYDGKITKMEYNADGSLKKLTDMSNRITTFTYDVHNRLLSINNNNEYSLAFTYDSCGRIGNVKYSNISSEQPSTADFTYDCGTTTVNYSGENAADTADDMILKYFFDENGSNTFAYAQNPKFGVYEKFAANGIKGIDCGAINDPENNITLYMNDDVMSGSKAFTMNSNSYEYPSVNLTTYYGDANTGDHSYKLETQTGRGTMNYIQKEVTLQPGEHTFSAYVKCINTSDANGTVSISIEDTWEDITECYEIPLSSCSNDWEKLTLDFSTTKEGIVSEEEDFARKFMLYINAKVSNDKNATILIDDITIDGKTLSYPTGRNALASCGFEGIEKMRWETTNTSLNYIYAADEPENVAFGNQSVKIEGSTSREKSLHHIVYMNYTTDQTKYRLSGWGKASSLPLKEDGSNGFELFAYYIYYVVTETKDEENNPVYTRSGMKTVSTAIPFDDQYDDWQYVSAELNAPEEDLADNQVIQIYSITIGTLYKNNSGNAYFDNIELTPVE